MGGERCPGRPSSRGKEVDYHSRVWEGYAMAVVREGARSHPDCWLVDGGRVTGMMELQGLRCCSLGHGTTEAVPRVA